MQFAVLPEYWERYQRVKEYHKKRGTSGSVWFEGIVDREVRRMDQLEKQREKEQ